MRQANRSGEVAILMGRRPRQAEGCVGTDTDKSEVGSKWRGRRVMRTRDSLNSDELRKFATAKLLGEKFY